LIRTSSEIQQQTATFNVSSENSGSLSNTFENRESQSVSIYRYKMGRTIQNVKDIWVSGKRDLEVILLLKNWRNKELHGE
jgi:hypothetical protein